jgi:hypothetical protein
MNVEADDAGRLRAFRARFGRGWDMKSGTDEVVQQEGEELLKEEEEDEDVDSLMDLISGAGGDGDRERMKDPTYGKRK